ncbi:MAG: FMN-binding protein [Elusimicrobia bacterium]|nr:FMN-binding protein [Elusimicrobiota bacterium]
MKSKQDPSLDCLHEKTAPSKAPCLERRLIINIGLLFLFGALNLRAESLKDQDYPDFVEQVYLTEQTALKSVFSQDQEIVKEIHAFKTSEKNRIEARLGWILQEPDITVYKGLENGNIKGYAVITEEIGKFKPITFIVKVSDKGQIERVEVMIYREPVGAEVRRQRFLRQFRKKSAKDSLRINRDILNITGATMSVQAMTAGIKKVLIILDELYIKK